MNESRTRHVVQNASAGLISQFVTTILSFASRTVFVYVLGKEYLGISGLFTNILMILSFAELGIGNAMVYSMYKPLKEGNDEKLKSLLLLYKKAYQVIGIVVGLAGVLIIPFLPIFIHGTVPNVKEPLVLIYILFLTNSVISYFYAYKQSIIIASQNEYIATFNSLLFNALCVILQIVVLYMTGNYILFLLCMIASTLLTNLSISRIANKKFPQLCGKAETLSKEERKSIFKNVKALAVYKLGSVILNGTNNIMISWMFNVGAVGIYANYVLFVNFFQTVNSKLMGSLTSSVGNLNTQPDPDKQYKVFNEILFVSCWINGFASIMMMLFVNDIIELWFGDDFLFDKSVLFCILFSYYIFTTSFAPYVFRTTLGLFTQGQLAPAIASILNVVLGYCMGKLLGIGGIFLATALARIFSSGIIDPVLIFRKAFKRSAIYYYLNYVFYIIVMFGLYFILLFILSKLVLSNQYVALFVRGIIAALLFNIFMCLIFYNTSRFQTVKLRITNLFVKK